MNTLRLARKQAGALIKTCNLAIREAQALRREAQGKLRCVEERAVRQIFGAVAEAAGFTLDELLCRRRWEPLATSRLVAFWLARKSGAPTCVVARVARRNHATILHAEWRVEALRSAGDKTVKSILKRLKRL
jgi:chromosomal replication initiation ATPase DnaA